MGQYTIKDVETLSGIKAHTLRIWEQRYKFIHPKRTDTNIRYYTDDDLRLILNISLLNQHGLKISKISKMPVEEISEKVKQISVDEHDEDQRIQNLIIAMVELDESHFEKIISTAMLQHGFEKTFEMLVFPFMERIGVLWATGSIQPMHEHFISHLIRQKLHVAIDGQVIKPNDNSHKFSLYLPEHELHDLGLLYALFMLKSRNQHVLYLGAQVPARDIIDAIGTYNPDYVFTTITVGDYDSNVSEDFISVVKHYPNTQFLLTGREGLCLDCDHVSNILKLNSVNETSETLNKIAGLI